MVKQELKDWRRWAIGQGAEAEFQKKVREREKTGIAREEAEKTTFLERFTPLLEEIRLTDGIDLKSKNYREFQAALHELFDPELIETFKRDAKDPAKCIPLSLPPLTSAHYGRIGGYYRKKFGGRAPEHPVITDAAENTKLIAEILRRFGSDPRLSSPDDLKTIAKSNPEIGAEIGRILLAKRELERHERKFAGELDFEEAMGIFKKDAKEVCLEMVFKAPYEFLVKGILKGLFTIRFDAFLKEFFQAAGREALAGTKLAVSAGKLAVSYGKKLMR